MACTFSPNLYLKAQDGHNCDASLWINEQGHISAEPLEMFLWEIRVQVMQNQVAIAMGNRVGCFASMFVRQVRQCFSAVWADGFPRCRHRFPVM